jgi:hypothetical protein
LKLLVLAAILAGLWLYFKPNKRKAPQLSSSEARRVLELDHRASRDEILEAHRRLIRRVHPDAGGSSDLAHRVNAARDILLAEVNRTDTNAL